MQLKLDPNETEHTLPDIVIALAGFIMSGNSVDYVDEEVLVLLSKAIDLELEARKGTFH
tara:strand:- start:14781 stop:14957 length:177 start_codon:yes stop_codon:yes gene_type:complete